MSPLAGHRVLMVAGEGGHHVLMVGVRASLPSPRTRGEGSVRARGVGGEGKCLPSPRTRGEGSGVRAFFLLSPLLPSLLLAYCSPLLHKNDLLPRLIPPLRSFKVFLRWRFGQACQASEFSSTLIHWRG